MTQNNTIAQAQYGSPKPPLPGRTISLLNSGFFSAENLYKVVREYVLDSKAITQGISPDKLDFGAESIDIYYINEKGTKASLTFFWEKTKNAYRVICGWEDPTCVRDGNVPLGLDEPLPEGFCDVIKDPAKEAEYAAYQQAAKGTVALKDSDNAPVVPNIKEWTVVTVGECLSQREKLMTYDEACKKAQNLMLNGGATQAMVARVVHHYHRTFGYKEVFPAHVGQNEKEA